MVLRRSRPRSPTVAIRRLAVSAATVSMLAGSALVTPSLLSFQLTREGWSGVDHTTSADRTHVRLSGRARSLEVWIQGAVSFDKDRTVVESVSRGGYIKVRERRGFWVRSVRVSPGADGLDYEYAAMGLVRDYDDDARSWFEQILQEVLDETGIGVRDKASELLAEGGVDALLDEIPTMRADRAKHISYDVLLDRAALTPELLVRTAAQALEQLETEHILADVLTRLADATGWLPSLAADDYFAAVRSLPSEHRRQRLLDLAIEAEGVPPSLVAGYFGVLDTFPSEHRRAHFIDLLLERRDSLDSLMLVLDALDLLPSEHRRHAVLDRLVPRLADDQEGTAAYFDTLGSIPSEHRRDQLLHRLLAQSDEWLVDNAELFLDALAELPSEHRRDALLRMLLPRFRRHDRLLLGLLDGVGSLPAEHRVAAFLDEMLADRDLSRDILGQMLSLTKERIPSAHRRGPLVERITDRLLG